MGTDKRARQKAGRQARLAEAEASAAKAESRRKLSRYLVLGAAIVLAVVLVGVFVLGGDDEPDLVVPTTTTAEETEATASTVPGLEEAQEPTCPPEGGTEEPVLQFTEAPPLCIDPTLEHTAVLTTSEGEIRVALDTETTPNTVNNFVFLARWGFYDDTLLHRTDPSIDIVQGGSPFTNTASDPGPGYTIEDEGGPYTYEPGMIAMARGSAPDSAGAQFFFSTGPNTALLDEQGTYVVFGRTDDAGLAVLEAIMALHEEDPSSGLGGRPSRDVVVESVTILVS
jgi:cyclophilin family peptidyl-prolyl cis-trans isomerase